MTELFVLSIVTGVLMIYIIRLKRKIGLLEEIIRVEQKRSSHYQTHAKRMSFMINTTGDVFQLRNIASKLNIESEEQLQLIDRSE